MKKPNYFKERPGEKITGGWFVFGRHSTSKRVRVPTQGFPFEHPDYESALTEAHRLSGLHPGKTYCVMQQMTVVAIQGEPQL